MAARQPPDDPKKWEKAVSAAYLRSIGHTQQLAAKTAGIGMRTLQAWEKSEWWPRAVWEAHQRWLSGIACATKGAINDCLKDPKEKGAMSRWIGERMIKELAPPRQRLEHTGKEGGPIETQSQIDLKKLTDDELADLKRVMLKGTPDISSS